MNKKRGRKSKKPNKAIFEMMYYNDNMTSKDLAKHFNVKEQTIMNWAYQYRKKEKE